MANAVFNSSLTACDEGSISQVFNLSSGYRTVSAGSIPVGRGDGATVIEIPFGKSAAEPRVVFVRNDTPGDLGVRLNEATADLYQLGPGGVFFHWSPAGPSSAPLRRVALSVGKVADEGGAISFVVLGG